jgi:hypothetical protein
MKHTWFAGGTSMKLPANPARLVLMLAFAATVAGLVVTVVEWPNADSVYVVPKMVGHVGFLLYLGSLLLPPSSRGTAKRLALFGTILLVPSTVLIIWHALKAA